jgi:hypothetical protein
MRILPPARLFTPRTRFRDRSVTTTSPFIALSSPPSSSSHGAFSMSRKMGHSAHSLSHFRRRRSVVLGTIRLYICASDVNLFLKALSASARLYIKRTGQQIRFSPSGNANFFLYIFSVCRILIKQRGYARFLLPTRALDVSEVQNKDYEV